MKFVKHALIVAGIAAALMVIPIETANAYWYGPGARYTPWRHAYFYDPGYRRAPPWMKCFIRDLHRRGPEYASWRQSRRYGYGRR